MKTQAYQLPRRQGWTLARTITVTLLLALIVAVLHLLHGPRDIAAQTVFQAFSHYNPANFDHFVIVHLRLPRILAVTLAGIALGTAGYLLQTALRNRLGEPHILGLNAGGALAVVLVTTFPDLALPVGVRPFAAAAGAGLLFSIVLMLASVGKERLEPARMVFFGIAISALANALVSAILILDENTLEQLRFWLVGDSAEATLSASMAALPPIAVGFLLACVLMPGLAVFGLGETLATSLGAWVKPTRVAAIVVSALLSGGAVSLVGPIGFVGLMAPNVWPSLHQRPSVGALILVALTGAGILLAADYLATGLLSPIELPTGAVTGLAGAPLFIWMVTRRNA